MSILIRWEVKYRVILGELVGDVGADELAAAWKEVQQIIDAVGVAPVYGVIDLSLSNRYPVRLSEFKTILQYPASDKLAWVIVSGTPNALAEFALRTFMHLMGKHYQVVSSLDEALEMIKKIEDQPV